MESKWLWGLRAPPVFSLTGPQLMLLTVLCALGLTCLPAQLSPVPHGVQAAFLKASLSPHSHSAPLASFPKNTGCGAEMSSTDLEGGLLLWSCVHLHDMRGEQNQKY